MRYWFLITALLFSMNALSKKVSSELSLLEQAHNDIKPNKYTGIDSLIVYQKGKLLAENYYDRFNASIPHRTHSTFKSITALITLIVADKKLIAYDEPVMPLLEGFRKLQTSDPRKKQITIRHLLNMSSGLSCDESPGSDGPNHEFGVDEGKSPLAYAMEIEMAAIPGGQWNYCNANSFMLAAAVSAALERAGQEDIFQFADKYLMKPLGITNYRLTKSYDGRFLNGQGNAYFLPKDLAKFGLLLLNKGEWQGNKIISRQAINLIYKKHFKVNWSFTDLVKGMPITETTYSHQWYRTGFDLKSKNIDVWHSWGNGGQFIYVIPELESVVVFTGSNQGNFTKQKQPFDILYQYILPELLKKKHG